MKKSDLFWQSYLNLEKSFIELSQYIFITDTLTVLDPNGNYVEQPYPSQLKVFSPHIADLLIQCCVQIEAISKELYHFLGGSKSRGDPTLLFDTDCLKEIDRKWATHNKTVLVVAFNLTDPNNRILKPLREAHKRSGTYWERAYQAVKHDRYASLSDGNVKALLHALAALYLLNLYFKNDSWLTNYQNVTKIDMSCGSKIFAVNPPRTSGEDNKPLWDDNSPVDSDSPYVVKYKESSFKQIKGMQSQDNNAANEYLQAQPEMKDQEFLTYFSSFINSGKTIDSVLTIAEEVGKFRLNKKIPQILPFEERKRLLIESPEWSGKIHMQNQHKQPEDITEENIQAEIDNVGRQAGMDLYLGKMRFAWLKMALNDEICEVKIPN